MPMLRKRTSTARNVGAGWAARWRGPPRHNRTHPPAMSSSAPSPVKPRRSTFGQRICREHRVTTATRTELNAHAAMSDNRAVLAVVVAAGVAIANMPIPMSREPPMTPGRISSTAARAVATPSRGYWSGRTAFSGMQVCAAVRVGGVRGGDGLVCIEAVRGPRLHASASLALGPERACAPGETTADRPERSSGAPGRRRSHLARSCSAARHRTLTASPEARRRGGKRSPRALAGGRRRSRAGRASSARCGRGLRPCARSGRGGARSRCW